MRPNMSKLESTDKIKYGLFIILRGFSRLESSNQWDRETLTLACHPIYQRTSIPPASIASQSSLGLAPPLNQNPIVRVPSKGVPSPPRHTSSGLFHRACSEEFSGVGCIDGGRLES
jgi:hypothetical protein